MAGQAAVLSTTEQQKLKYNCYQLNQLPKIQNKFTEQIKPNINLIAQTVKANLI